MFGSLTTTDIIYLIIGILIAMAIHEATHAYVGFKLGDDTAAEQGRISLNPLKHIDPFATVILPIITLVLFQAPILAAKPVPFNPDRVRFEEFGAALIAVAGPVSNFVLAVISALIIRGLAPGTVFENFIEIFLVLNVSLMVFNLIPIPPLDGSRVLYAFAPESLQRFMSAVEPFGFFIIFALVLYGGIGGFLLTAIQGVINFLL
jgi:Zn-dependent protease